MWITCGLLWCFYQLFGLSFWRHPFTAEEPLVSKWCNATFLQIWWRNKLIYILAWGWVHFYFWVNYSFKISLGLNTVLLTWGACHTWWVETHPQEASWISVRRWGASELPEERWRKTASSRSNQHIPGSSHSPLQLPLQGSPSSCPGICNRSPQQLKTPDGGAISVMSFTVGLHMHTLNKNFKKSSL